MLRKYSVIDKETLEEIEAFERECHEHDAGGVALYLENDAADEMVLKPFYSIYKKGQLVAFLSLFVADEDNVEINAVTKPEYRKRGYFKKLLKAALKDTKKAGIENVWFVTDGHTKHLKDAAEKISDSMNAVFDYSEYVHLFDKTEEATYYDKGISIVPPEECFTLGTVHELFPGEFADDEWFRGWRTDVDKKLCNFADVNGERIGICSIYKSGDTACICNFGIVKEHQRKGFGKAALRLLINELVKEHENIILQVSGKNEAAYNLYINNGFVINEARDYYKLRKG